MVHGSSSPSSWAQPNAENAPAALGLLHEVFDLRASDLADARQKRPLVGPWHETLVEEYAIPRSRGLFCSGNAMRLPNPPCGKVS